MNFTPNPTLVPDRDSLPLKKRDQRQSTPQQQQQQCDAATFKVPYPYKSHSEFKIKHTSPFQPVPRRVPALYQPWMQTHASTRSKPHVLSAFREHHGWAEWREFNPLHPGWDFSHHYQHHGHLPSHHREISLHPSHSHHPSRFNPVSPVTEGFHWELVDVYVEYPFFVRGQGWSSCSPQRTARLCGLQCRQLSVGDVCLALTPVSAPQPSPSATPEAETSPRKSEGECGSLKASSPQVPPGPESPARGQKKEAEAVRRRHYSAPELRGPGTNCI
eukprot:superscaffoldBa00001573_g11147